MSLLCNLLIHVQYTHTHTHTLHIYIHHILYRGCGNGHFLGHGTTDHVRYPRQVLGLSNQMVTQVINS